MAKKNDFIAVIDSGVGGISVLRRLRQVLPNERYLYFGDSANAPYGTRPEKEVEQLTLAMVERLLPYGLKALVIACNTATSAAYNAVAEAYPQLVVVGIEPALAQAADAFPGGHVGVMATPGTLKGNRFLQRKACYEKVCKVTPLPAPGLMELVEAEKFDSPEADALLEALLPKDLDALVLGCTHYPFAAGAISRVLGQEVRLLDGGDGTARETGRRLKKAGLLEQGDGEVLIINSSGDPAMCNLSRELLNK